MKVSILASGSNGNSTLVETQNESFLIDDGLSFKMLLSRMLECNAELEKIKKIFLTHEHVDHVCGVKVLLKRVPLECYMTNGTYAGLNQETREQVELSKKVIIKNGDVINIGECKVTVLQMHHDSREPVGFVIEENDKKVVYITDTGYVDQAYFPLISNANLYIMESNYDVEMLWSSSRPFDLKKRIDGDYGHMSNVASAVLLGKIIGPKTKQVVLAHISDDCNYYHMPELILNEHKKVYNEIGIDYSDVKFYFGNRKGVTGVFEI